MTDETTTPEAKPAKRTAKKAASRKPAAKKPEPLGLPIVGGRNADAGRSFHVQQSERWARNNAERADAEIVGWDGIALEELHRAFALVERENIIAALTKLRDTVDSALADAEAGE